MSDVDYAPTLAQKIGAEALGTFVLVLFGVGTAVVSEGNYVATGLAFGIAVLAMAYAVGSVSGGHFNPAVSVGQAFAGRLSWANAGIYSAAQIAGAAVAGLLLFLFMIATDTGFEWGDGLGANGFGDHGGVTWWGALLVEIVFTAVFVLIILLITDNRFGNDFVAPIGIGLALTGVHFASMGFTGTSVNPARSIGAALFSSGDALAQIWLFIIAPLVGAAIAGLLKPLIWGRDADPVAGSGLAAFSGGSKQPQQQWGQQQGWGQQQQGWGADAGQQQAGWGAQQGQQQAAAAPVENQYPGWRWDAQAQQWVPDASTAPAEGGAHAAVEDEGPRTQIRNDDA